MDILADIRSELRNNREEENVLSQQRFFKEKIRCYGVRTPVVRKIAKQFFRRVQHLEKKEILSWSEALFQSGYNEEAVIAVQWAQEYVEQCTENDFILFEKWLTHFVDNWAKDDDFCLHLISPLIRKYPRLVHSVKQWTSSENKWLRRASAVSFIISIQGFYVTTHDIHDIFDVAEMLLLDPEDLVQKGYGWMLKATSLHRQNEVFEFVLKHKENMPRTALRYAIEKMPNDLRKKALS